MSPHSNPDKDRPEKPPKSIWKVALDKIKANAHKLLFTALLLSTLIIENAHENFSESTYCVAYLMPAYHADCEVLGKKPGHSDLLTGKKYEKDCIDAEWFVLDNAKLIIICIFLLAGIIKPKGKYGDYQLKIFLAVWIIEIADLWLDFNLASPKLMILFTFAFSNFVIWKYWND